MKSGELLAKVLALGLTVAALATVSCSKTKDHTEIQYMPDMSKGPSLKAQQVNDLDPAFTAVRVPVKGTIPRDYDPYPFATADTVGPAMLLFNPLPRTKEVFLTGRKYFNNYCIVCHGPKGDGRGYITSKFPAPPSLLTERIRDFQDGRIFHLITRGRGNMPGYATQLKSAQRWAIVYYVRALYRAAYPNAEDLKILKDKKLELLFLEDDPDTSAASSWPKK